MIKNNEILFGRNAKLFIGEDKKPLGRVVKTNFDFKNFLDDQYIKNFLKEQKKIISDDEFTFKGYFSRYNFHEFEFDDLLNDFGLCEYDYIEEDVELVFNGKALSIACGLKFGTPGVVYFLWVCP